VTRQLSATLTLLLVLGLTAPRVAGALTQRAPQDGGYSSGRSLYRAHCAPCHGNAGRGDGPVADIQRLRPADLTSIARRKGGVFPRDEMTRVVDGRERIAGHERGEMPVWGRVLPEATDLERRKQIAALVAFVESLQVMR
jgi:mono/diheme cytochrome c family protein